MLLTASERAADPIVAACPFSMHWVRMCVKGDARESQRRPTNYAQKNEQFAILQHASSTCDGDFCKDDQRFVQH
jgi:hypothetical protein